MLELRDKYFSKQKFSRKKQRLAIKPWLTKEILISIKHKHKLYKTFVKDKFANNFRIYKKYHKQADGCKLALKS